jgi:hypothetical protein
MVPTTETLAGQYVLLVMVGEEVLVSVRCLDGQARLEWVGHRGSLRGHWAQQLNVQSI